MSKHIAILGAGPGGDVAAIRAAQVGARGSVIRQQAAGLVPLPLLRLRPTTQW